MCLYVYVCLCEFELVYVLDFCLFVCGRKLECISRFFLSVAMFLCLCMFLCVCMCVYGWMWVFVLVYE